MLKILKIKKSKITDQQIGYLFVLHVLLCLSWSIYFYIHLLVRQCSRKSVLENEMGEQGRVKQEGRQGEEERETE